MCSIKKWGQTIHLQGPRLFVITQNLSRFPASPTRHATTPAHPLLGRSTSRTLSLKKLTSRPVAFPADHAVSNTALLMIFCYATGAERRAFISSACCLYISVAEAACSHMSLYPTRVLTEPIFPGPSTQMKSTSMKPAPKLLGEMHVPWPLTFDSSLTCRPRS